MALVAQRVGDHPVVEQTFVVLPLTDTKRSSGAEASDAFVGAVPDTMLNTVPDTAPDTAPVTFSETSTDAILAASPDTIGAIEVDTRSSNELVFQQAENIPNPPSLGQTKLTPKEIHPNPGKAFGTAPTTTPQLVSRTASAKSAKPSKPADLQAPATQKPPTLAASARSKKRTPIPLAPVAAPSTPAAADEFAVPTDQSPPAFLPEVITPDPPVPVEPPILIITAAPTPVISTGASSSASSGPATIPASAIVIVNPPPVIQAATPVLVAPVTPAPAPATPAPFVSSTTTKPALVVQQAYQLSNGTVGVHCVGNQIVLDFATPAPGASVKVKSSGPDEVKLKFRSKSGDTSRSDSDFSAVCRRGTPAREN